MTDEFALARRYGSLAGAAEIALAYLKGENTWVGKETVVRALERSLAHDGTEAFRLFPELTETDR